MDRRQFLKTGAACLAASTLPHVKAVASNPMEKRIYNAVKWTMIKGELSVLEKFQMTKDAGFDGTVAHGT